MSEEREVGRVVKFPFSGMNRAERRARLKGTPALGMHTRELHRLMGEAWTENLEAKAAMRRNRKAAELVAKYETVKAE